jgi:predicted nucleotidyltransferase
MPFYTQNQIDILAFLLAHEGEERSLSEIGEAIGKLPGVFKRGIDALERDGVLASRKRGSLRLFSINAGYLFLEEIKSVVKKTAGVEGSLRKFVEAEDSIVAALIYGSYAKNKMRADSDIDFLLVMKDDNIDDKLIRGISAIERKIGREINYKFYGQKEFVKKKKSNDAFLNEVLNDRYILLKGNIA